jgi:hypothetical protein
LNVDDGVCSNDNTGNINTPSSNVYIRDEIQQVIISPVKVYQRVDDK